jgi:hypothetical protein
MKSLRDFVILMLLGIAAPLAIHYRAWSMGTPAATPRVLHTQAHSSEQVRNATESQNTAAQPVATAQTAAVNSDLTDSSLDLPGASSSLPLLSVIGFGVFIGGLISALRTRPAHK